MLKTNSSPGKILKGVSHPRGTRNYAALLHATDAAWLELCARYLPIVVEDSIWRFSRPISTGDPEQGWKIHVSATVLSANKVLGRVAPFLSTLGVLFKATNSLVELKKLNCGLYEGFSQVGKCITVYARTSEEAVFIARKLHRLTYKIPAPQVPYDLPFRENSCIYYRYGSFSSLEIGNPDGTTTPGIRTPEGAIVPDLREHGKAVPAWIADPFVRAQKRRRTDPPASPLSSTIRVYEALSQRGKGGVYRALDLSISPARLCVVKEGRRNGETDFDGRDGAWRVRHEAQVLHALSPAGVRAPKVYTEFEIEGNYYVVMEFIEGRNLQLLLSETQGKLPVDRALGFGIRLAKLLAKIHSLGWVWRDCKPLNLILTEDDELHPLDFEGACMSNVSETMPWGTTGYVPGEWLEEPATGSRLPEDLYALGANLHQLLSGTVPGVKSPPPIGVLRRRVPRTVREIIAALLDPVPIHRPDALTVAQVLEEHS